MQKLWPSRGSSPLTTLLTQTLKVPGLSFRSMHPQLSRRAQGRTIVHNIGILTEHVHKCFHLNERKFFNWVKNVKKWSKLGPKCVPDVQNNFPCQDYCNSFSFLLPHVKTLRHYILVDYPNTCFLWCCWIGRTGVVFCRGAAALAAVFLP